jgi:hypothetical protein
MLAGRWRGVAPLIACVGVCAGVLHVGLRPYAFFEANRVAWSAGEPGLRFDGRGIAGSEEPFERTASGRSGSLSVEAWLRRDASPVADGGVVLAVADGGGSAPLLLAQWQSSLYFRFPVPGDGAPPEQTLALGDAFPAGSRRYVALTSDELGSRAYLESQAIATSPLPFAAMREEGNSGCRIALGSSLQASRGWTGRVDGLALYDRALSGEEIARHGERVGRDGLRALIGERGLLALYAFDAGAGASVRDLAGGAGDLLIPTHYRSLDPASGWLTVRAAGRSAGGSDGIRNFAGFVPVGLLLVGVLYRRAPRRGPSAAWTAVALGFSLSLLIETLQVWLPSRVSAAEDLALNTLGTAVGALVAGAALRLIRAGLQRG